MRLCRRTYSALDNVNVLADNANSAKDFDDVYIGSKPEGRP